MQVLAAADPSKLAEVMSPKSGPKPIRRKPPKACSKSGAQLSGASAPLPTTAEASHSRKASPSPAGSKAAAGGSGATSAAASNNGQDDVAALQQLPAAAATSASAADTSLQQPAADPCGSQKPASATVVASADEFAAVQSGKPPADAPVDQAGSGELHPGELHLSVTPQRQQLNAASAHGARQPSSPLPLQHVSSGSQRVNSVATVLSAGKLLIVTKHQKPQEGQQLSSAAPVSPAGSPQLPSGSSLKRKKPDLSRVGIGDAHSLKRLFSMA